MNTLTELLEASAALHRHLCPRQVLGVRMSMYAGELLGLDLPQSNKRLFTFVETDGCAADGIAVGANCWVGRRTMRIEDYGKVAATFVDTHTHRALRLAPLPGVRDLAREAAPEASSRWHAQLLGYQRLAVEQMFSAQPVHLTTPIEQIISRPGARAACDACGEEIMNEREVERDGRVLCVACAGPAYYAAYDELAWQPQTDFRLHELAG